MSRNVRQIGYLGCFLLVLLRVAIGWQFLYEGLWKLKTQNTSKPWSAEGYLVNARGPFREKFRRLVEDPNGLDKLDYDKVVARWDAWRDGFLAQYANVTDVQKSLDKLLDGPQEIVQPLEQLPPGIDLNRDFKCPKGFHLKYNPKAKRLETNLHLLPAERDALLALAMQKPASADAEVESPAQDRKDQAGAGQDPGPEPPAAVDAVIKKWQQAIKQLYIRTSRLSLKERLQVLLKEDTERVGTVLKAQAGTIDHERPGKKQVYEHLLARYEQNLKQVRESFQQDHLETQWREIMKKKAELVGPVDALTAEFHSAAYDLLKADEAQQGPVLETPSQIRQINQLTMWSLTILGAALMAGFFSRLSALGAAGLLLLFYLPMPPWPGVPEPPGPEHSLYINKNLIEFFACLALAFIPTGRWIGVDAFMRRFIFRRKTD